MTIELKLFGFGDDRPAPFGKQNRLQLNIDTPATPRAVLRAIGIDDNTGLVIMSADRVIPQNQWDQAKVNDEDCLILLSAFEGG